jgi:hypothetical protein
MRLHSGEGAIISGESDHSPQVMAEITSSPEPLWEEKTVNQSTPVTGTV